MNSGARGEVALARRRVGGIEARLCDGEEHCIPGPSALIGASNFFELAVAAAISRLGFNSGAALATVVGVQSFGPARRGRKLR
ncbi:MAG: arsenic transporter [Hyphomicrobiales bacterium]|nr:arsenic transporter [Hyphomicrobiales bacterium]